MTKGFFDEYIKSPAEASKKATKIKENHQREPIINFTEFLDRPGPNPKPGVDVRKEK